MRYRSIKSSAKVYQKGLDDDWKKCFPRTKEVEWCIIHRMLLYEEIKRLYGENGWLFINNTGWETPTEVKINLDLEPTSVTSFFLYKIFRDEIIILSPWGCDIRDKTLIFPGKEFEVWSRSSNTRTDSVNIASQKSWQAAIMWCVTDDSDWSGRSLKSLTGKIILR